MKAIDVDVEKTANNHSKPKRNNRKLPQNNTWEKGG
jgi:hypothetical protein